MGSFNYRGESLPMRGNLIGFPGGRTGGRRRATWVARGLSGVVGGWFDLGPLGPTSATPPRDPAELAR